VLIRGGTRVALSPKAFDLLEMLVERHGRLVDKQEILAALWPDSFVEEANLSVQVAAVRKALGGEDYIDTIPKRGYRFVGKLEFPSAVARDGGEGAEPIHVTVLPLRALGTDADTGFLAFSLPDAIAGSLAEHPWLVVRAPQAGPASVGPEPDTALSADVVLQGTFTSAGGNVRVRFNLVKAATGTVLMSREVTASLGNLFDVQTSVAGDVARTLGRGRMALGDGRMAAPVSPGAYVFYLRANQLAYETSHWAQARDLYGACLREDPNYAPAWARLARCHRVIGKFASDAALTAASFARAESAFERALALDPDLSLAHSLYAQLEVDTGRAERAVVRLMKRARRQPHAPELYSGLVHALRFSGLLDLSIAAHARARALDPGHPTSVHHTWWMMGEYERALSETLGDIGYMPGLALSSLGRTREAIAALRWRERESPDTRIGPYIRSLRALLEGKRVDSLRAVDCAIALPVDGEALYYMARTYAKWAEVERAVDAMTRVVDSGFVSHTTFARDPWLDPIRRDGRFAAILEQARQRSARAALLFDGSGGRGVLGGVASRNELST
jgi:TolB-like protein/Flp pilus assembly protein TadD